MLRLAANIPVFMAAAPVNMRLSFDSLAGLVHKQTGKDSMSRDLYVLFNKRADCVKILVWDRHGRSLLYKRLEKETFRPPSAKELEAKNMEICNAELVMILEGIEIRDVKFRQRWLKKK